MQPEREPAPEIPADEVELDEAPQVRVEVAPDPVPTVAVAPEPDPLPRADAVGIVGVLAGGSWAALGTLIAIVGLSLGLDRWSPDWGTGFSLILVGVILGVLPGLLGGALGVGRIAQHTQLRRLVAATRGNDSVDIPTLAKRLEVSEKKARRLTIDALARRLLDARYDAQSDRLILKPARSPFR